MSSHGTAQTDARSLYTALPVLLCCVLCAAMCSALIKTSLSIKQQRMVGWRPCSKCYTRGPRPAHPTISFVIHDRERIERES